MFGNPETTTGGKALKYYASVRMEMRKTQAIKEGDTSTGIKVIVKVVKNKVAPPFRQAEFDIMFAEGISKEGNLLDVGAEFGVVKKSGAWYEFNGEKLGQGREASKAFLKENPKIRNEIDKKIRETVSSKEDIPLKLGGEDHSVSEAAETDAQ
jgi:recombination protein RecA